MIHFNMTHEEAAQYLVSLAEQVRTGDVVGVTTVETGKDLLVRAAVLYAPEEKPAGGVAK